MKRVLVAIGMLATVGIRSAWAQSAGDCVPSALNIPEAKSPCVYSDHRVLFRVVAPDAQKVRARIGPGFDMTKGPDRIWTVTTTPLVVGFHYYSLQIDGAAPPGWDAARASAECSTPSWESHRSKTHCSKTRSRSSRRWEPPRPRCSSAACGSATPVPAA